jgi:hypothetical protein
MNKVAVMFVIYDESKYLDLVSKAAQGIAELKGEFDLFVIMSQKTPQEEKKLVHDILLREYTVLFTPISIDSNIPLKHAWAYQKLVAQGYEYIMINQADDIPMEDRLVLQLQSLQDHPEAALCLAGFTVIRNNDPRTAQKDYFQQCKCGFNVGYPSCWLMNAKILRELPNLVGFERPLDFEWDPYMLLQILQWYPIIGIQKPLEIYNHHANNLSAQIPLMVQETRFMELCRVYTFLQEEKRLKPYLVIK